MHGRTARWRRFVCGRRRSFFAGGRSFFRGRAGGAFFPAAGTLYRVSFAPAPDCASPLDGFALRKGLCDALAEVLAKQIPSGGENFFSARRDPQSGEEEGEKIAYFRNRFSDEAYDSVYAYLTSLPSPAGAAGGPLAVYTDSFSHAAELLSEGRCTAVLFPCETEDGHFLPSVEGLIREYDLKKTVVCPLSPKLGGASYALLRKSLCFTPACSHGEFRLPRNNKTARALYELPLLAAADGLTVERAETLLSAGGKDAALRFLFRADGATGEGDRSPEVRRVRERAGGKILFCKCFSTFRWNFPTLRQGDFTGSFLFRRAAAEKNEERFRIAEARLPPPRKNALKTKKEKEDEKLSVQNERHLFFRDFDPGGGGRRSGNRLSGRLFGQYPGRRRLAAGRRIDEVISLLRGIRCGMKATSCPDQLAEALVMIREGRTSGRLQVLEEKA